MPGPRPVCFTSEPRCRHPATPVCKAFRWLAGKASAAAAVVAVVAVHLQLPRSRMLVFPLVYCRLEGPAAAPAAGGRGGAGRGGAGAGPAIRPGSLKIVTTHLSPGYLRKNGVPYSANTTLTEYFDRTFEPNGDSLLIVSTIVDDPQYLTGQFLTSTHFKRLADTGPGWNPTPCEAK